MNKKGAVYFVVVLVLVTATAFIWRSYSGTETAEGKTWLDYVPVQCMGNPWEQDWLESNGGDSASYPKEREMKIIKSYFEKNGVQVFDMRRAQRAFDQVCLACSCPRGDLISLLVSDSQVEKMLALGFKKSIKPAAAPPPAPDLLPEDDPEPLPEDEAGPKG